MRTVTMLITRRVMVEGQARAVGEVLEVPGGVAQLLISAGRAVVAPEAPPAVEEAPKPRRRARAAKGRFQADDPATPDVNEAWADV